MTIFGLGLAGFLVSLVAMVASMAKGKSSGSLIKMVTLGTTLSGALMVGGIATQINQLNVINQDIQNQKQFAVKASATQAPQNSVSVTTPSVSSSNVQTTAVKVSTKLGGDNTDPITSPITTFKPATTTTPTATPAPTVKPTTTPTATPDNSKAPVEIVNYNLAGQTDSKVDSSGTELTYNVKNNSDKVVHSYKIIITAFDANNKPVFIIADGNSGYPSTNLLLQNHVDYDLNPSETKGALGGMLQSSSVKKVKIVVSEVSFVGGTTWVNSDNDKIMSGHNTF